MCHTAQKHTQYNIRQIVKTITQYSQDNIIHNTLKTTSHTIQHHAQDNNTYSFTQTTSHKIQHHPQDNITQDNTAHKTPTHKR